MEADAGQGKARKEANMAGLAGDPELRHEYMLRQAMVRSLEPEVEIR